MYLGQKFQKKYFGKSASWLYHKLDGIDGQGNPNGVFQQKKKNNSEAVYMTLPKE